MTASRKRRTLIAVAAAASSRSATSVQSSSSASLLRSTNPVLFASRVAKMNRQRLNRQKTNALPRWARAILEQEKHHRKSKMLQQGKPLRASAATTHIRTASSATATTVTAITATTKASRDAKKPKTTSCAPTKATSTKARPRKKSAASRAPTKTAAITTTTITTTRKTTKVATVTTAAAGKVTLTTAAKPQFRLKLPSKKSDAALVELKDKLQELERQDLNRIDMKAIPPWTRPFIDQERCKRKSIDTDIGTLQNFVSDFAQVAIAGTTTSPPMVCAPTVHAFAPTYAESSSSSTATSKSGRCVPMAYRNKQQGKRMVTPTGPSQLSYHSSSRPRYGNDLHKQLLAAAKKSRLMWNCNIVYDDSLQLSKNAHNSAMYDSRIVFGKCATCCERANEQQRSAQVFTQFWYRHIPASGGQGTRDTIRYRSLVNFTTCRGCGEREVDLDHKSYVSRALKAFELWSGRRARDASDPGTLLKTKPHDWQQCFECIRKLPHQSGGGRKAGGYWTDPVFVPPWLKE